MPPALEALPEDRARELQPVPSALFTRIFALVLATVVVAQLINLALLALLPPAPTRSLPLSVVSAAIAQPVSAGPLRSEYVVRPDARIEQDSPAAGLIEAELARRLGVPADAVWLLLAPVQRGKTVMLYPEIGGARQPEPALLGHFLLHVRQPDGRWVQYTPRDETVFDSRERRFLLLFLASALAMLPIAWLFAKRLAAPFAQFADAAERLGRDPSAPPPAIDGPAEVARAARAFADMQARLGAYVDDRTQMIAAIAHDLRTQIGRAHV